MKRNKLLGIIGGLSIAVAGVAAVVGGLSNKEVEVKAEDSTKEVFLKPNSDWASAGAWFAVRGYNSDSDQEWHGMTKCDSYGIYASVLSKNYSHVKFYRMDPNKHDLDESSAWNKSNELTIDNDIYYPIGWTEGGGSWGSYGWYLKGSFNEWQATDNYKMELDHNDLSQFKFTVDLNKDDTFKLFGSNDEHWVSFSNIEMPASDTGYLVNDGGNIKVATGGRYKMYMKASGKAWIQYDYDYEDAKAYAGTFLTTIICDDGVTPPSTSSWTDMKTSYNALPVNAQGVLWLASASESGSTIEQAMARYDYIVAKYGSSTYENFINRESASSSRIAINPISVTNTSSWIIVAVSLAGLTAIGGFFFYKKRKEN